MQTRQFLVLCLSAIGLSSSVQAQEVMYVHTQGQCMAHDMNNIEVVTISADSVGIGTDAAYRKADVDSITFVAPQGEAWQTGWWGDLQGGRSVCFYEQRQSAQPDVELLSADSICQKACCYFDDLAAQSRGPRKVGKKWRYVRGTLSGHHQLEYHFLDDSGLLGGYQPVWSDAGDVVGADLTPLLTQHRTSEVRRVVNYWYRPEIAAQMPQEPVFGTCDQNLQTYSLRLLTDSVSLHVKLNCYRDEDGALLVVSDSMQIAYKSDYTAQRDFKAMSALCDDSLDVFISENVISVVERFEPTPLEEVCRWLVRFDLDMSRPVFIRDEE